MSDFSLPRSTKLQPFDPHRKTFECKHEVDVVPTVGPEAERLFQQALALDSGEVWPQDRDYLRMAELYRQAAVLGHWKAQFNLAGLYMQGLGVPRDVDKALALTEDLMKKGVPAAWDNMGTMYMGGIGPLKQDATVAYAFWQRAADMGSKSAQAFLGEKLDSDIDDAPTAWNNRKIGRQMLECAFSQGSGEAALTLGVSFNVIEEDFDRSVRYLHQGVKWGSRECASYLAASFGVGFPGIPGHIDKWRAERYQVFYDYLGINPSLRFPNLDKVLPLPPAELPFWIATR